MRVCVKNVQKRLGRNSCKTRCKTTIVVDCDFDKIYIKKRVKRIISHYAKFFVVINIKTVS